MSLLNVAGCSVSYQVFGEGTPIVFIPPPVVGSSVFYYQAAYLSSEFKVILPELRGHGKSSPSDYPLTYPLIADDVRHLLDHLDIEKAVISGYSMGGSAVYEFIKRYPERTLGCMGISAFTETTDLRLHTELTIAIQAAKANAIGPMAFGLALANADRLKTFQYLYRVGLRSDTKAVLTMFQYAIQYNCTRDMSHFNVPICLVFGREDSRLSHQEQVLKPWLRPGTILTIPNAGHQIPTKNTHALHQVIRTFVRDLDTHAVDRSTTGSFTSTESTDTHPSGTSGLSGPTDAQVCGTDGPVSVGVV